MKEPPCPIAPSEVSRAYRQIPMWARGELADLSEAQLDRTGAEGMGALVSKEDN